MRSILSSCLLSFICSTAGLPAQSPLPDDDSVTVEMRGNERPQMRLAFPFLAGAGALPGPDFEAASRELEDTLRSDLELSGIFAIQGPIDLTVLQLTGNRRSDLDLYRSLGNEVLLEGGIQADGDRLVLESQILDLKSGQQIVGKRYRGTLDLARKIAHTFADEVVYYFSGRRGIAQSTVAFYSDRDGQNLKELYLMDYDGRNQRRISNHQTLSLAPDWHPSNDRIAYISYVEGPPGIFQVDLATGQKTPLVIDGTMNSSPAYSPDGSRIAFSRSLSGNPEVFVAHSDGTGLRRLTNSPGIDTNPSWNPKGRQLAFTSSRSGRPQIYVMSSEGSDLRRVTFEGSYNDGAVWTPDGSRILYSSRRDRSSFSLALTDIVTLETKLLASGDGSYETPTISPDGRRVAFALKGRGSRTQIYSMDLDGSHRMQLTHEGNNHGPDWSNLPE